MVIKVWKVLIAFVSFFLIGCVTTSSNSKTQLEEWFYNAPRCDGYVSKDDCEDGDSVLFSGLLCLAGVDIGCITVRDSQDDEGQWWRSPRRNPGNLGKQNSFSRDQSLGVLAYLVATKDQEAANYWYRWISKNRPCLVKIGNHCSVKGLHRFCRDDDDKRCTITPAIWKLMGKVWEHIGLIPSATMKQYRTMPDLPVTDEKGYVLHLEAVKEYIRQKMAPPIVEDKAWYENLCFMQNDPEVSSVVQSLLNKEPENPFFMYLAEGKTGAVTDRYEELCPIDYDLPKTQWAWERRSGKAAWEKSMLWDCIFMKSL